MIMNNRRVVVQVEVSQALAEFARSCGMSVRRFMYRLLEVAEEHEEVQTWVAEQPWIEHTDTRDPRTRVKQALDEAQRQGADRANAEANRLQMFAQLAATPVGQAWLRSPKGQRWLAGTHTNEDRPRQTPLTALDWTDPTPPDPAPARRRRRGVREYQPEFRRAPLAPLRATDPQTGRFLPADIPDEPRTPAQLADDARLADINAIGEAERRTTAEAGKLEGETDAQFDRRCMQRGIDAAEAAQRRLTPPAPQTPHEQANAIAQAAAQAVVRLEGETDKEFAARRKTAHAKAYKQEKEAAVTISDEHPSADPFEGI